MDLSNFWLFLYCLTWLITFYLYQKKKKIFDAGSLILLSYLGYSILSYYAFNHTRDLAYNEIRFFPFLYLYLMTMLAVSPVLRFDQLKTRVIQRPSKYALNTVCIIYIIASLCWIPSIASNIVGGITRIMIDTAAGQDIYNDVMAESRLANIGDGAIANLPAIIAGVLCDVGILIFFYYLTLENRNKFILVGLFISIIVTILSPIAESQRGPAIDRMLAVMVTYCAFRSYYSTRVRKLVGIIGVSALIIVLVPLIAITISRFDDGDSGALDSVAGYAGMQNLNFNNYGLDNGGIRYGDRTFPMFKRMLGFSNVPHNFWERRDKYPHLKIDDGYFIGFVGDFTLDFGPFIAPMIFILFTSFVLARTRIRKGRILFHQLILLHFVMNICMEGGLSLYSYADTGNLRVIAYFLAYVFFSIDYSNSKKNQMINESNS